MKKELNLNKILSGSLFKGETLKKWLDTKIDYFFEQEYKPLNFEYDSDKIFEIENLFFGKKDKDKIRETYNKYKDAGGWSIRIENKGRRFKTKLPNKLIELWLNKKP